jgi:hypothetical protein
MRVAIIGFGHAGQAYLSALTHISPDSEVLIVDIDSSIRARVPNFASFDTKLHEAFYDLIVIATPPSSHLNDLKRVFQSSSRILMEKPFTLDRVQLYEVLELARSGRIFFSIHARYGKELELLARSKETSPYLDVSNVLQMICDPYYPMTPKNLGGPFWDSIYNAIGIMHRIFQGFKLSKIQVNLNNDYEFDMTCRAYANGSEFDYRLLVDWRRSLSLKVTEISNLDRSHGFLVNHSQQCLSLLSGLTLEYVEFKRARLSSHYEAALLDCLETDSFDKNYDMAVEVSKEVLKIVDCMSHI